MKLLPALLILIAFTQCKDKRKIPDNFDYGETKNGLYTNNYLGFQFRTPDGWQVQSKEQVKAVMKEGAEIIEEHNKDLSKEIKAADVRSAALYAAFRYPTDSVTGKFNSSISIAVENIAGVHEVKSGKDYINSARKMMERSGIDYTKFSNVETESINGHDFDVMKTELTMKGIPLRQRYYATIIKKFALVMIATFQTDEEEAEFDQIVRGIKFN